MRDIHLKILTDTQCNIDVILDVLQVGVLFW